MWGETNGAEKRIFQVSDAWRGKLGHGVGGIDTGRGRMPMQGANVAVLPKALGTRCSILRKEVPCLVADNYRGGTASD